MNIINSMPQIHFAPLQGYTDNAFRKAFDHIIGNIDYYYTPYLSVENDNSVKSTGDLLDIDDRLKVKTIPQVLPATVQEVKLLLKPILKEGFRHLNINMGCPYPMATRKGRGAALVHQPALATDIINYLSDHTPFLISIKARSGLTNHETIFSFFEKIPLEKIERAILHPRTASQLYKGDASIDVFRQCKKHYPNLDLIYNGDISSFSAFGEKLTELPEQNSWMIGRGLLHNPFLAWQIKNRSATLPVGHNAIRGSFIDELVRLIILDSKNKEHALNRCKVQLSMLFETEERFFKYSKKMKKARNMEEVQVLIKALKLMDQFN